MKEKIVLFPVIILIVLFITVAVTRGQDVKIVFIRHGEKSANGDNLSCQGINRSLLLPAVLFKKFGMPDHIYVPAVKPGEVTKHMRMLQTITPFAAKYDLTINSDFDVDDVNGIGKTLIRQKGTQLVIWEHQELPAILKILGVDEKLKWADNDFDSIWIVTYKKGELIFSRDTENLRPSAGCSF